MAISNLLPAGNANDNRPNLKQFFGKNLAVANDNVERVSSGMFSNSFVDSIVSTLHGLVEEIAKIADIAKSVIASFGTIIKSLKNLNKEVTSRFRVLNNEMNASRIDFIRTVLAIPKTDAPVKIDGVPVNVNQQEAPKKEDDKDGFFKDLFEKLMLGWVVKNLGEGALKILQSLLSIAGTLIKLAGSIALDLIGKLPALFRLLGAFALTPVGAGLIAGATIAILMYKGLEELTKAIMEDPDFQRMVERDKNKTEKEMLDEANKNIAVKLGGGNRQKKSAEQLVKGNKWGDNGQELKGGDFKTVLNTDMDPAKSERIAVLVKPLADGTKAINIDTGEKYGIFDPKSIQGDVKAGGIIGAPAAAPAGAPSGSPMPAGAPSTSSPAALGQTGAGGFGLGGATGTTASPAGAPAGEIKKESNVSAPPPSGAPSGTPAVTFSPPPPAGPSGGGGGSGGGGVAVVQNSSVKNVGTTAGAENGGMTGQNLPMFARNPKLQNTFGMQTVKYQ